jgi:hypothetical protein
MPFHDRGQQDCGVSACKACLPLTARVHINPGKHRSRPQPPPAFTGLAVTGVALGLAASFGLTRLIASLLFGVKAWDPMVSSTVPLVLIGVALVAVWLPALRASRVDPIHALRYE